MKFEVASQLLRRWLEAVNAGDLAGVAELYRDDAVLIPTFSSKRLIENRDREHYFAQLARRRELSITLHEKTLIQQHLTAANWVISGIYKWRFEVDGELLSYEARFTLVVDLEAAAPIIHHHSSQVPGSPSD